MRSARTACLRMLLMLMRARERRRIAIARGDDDPSGGHERIEDAARDRRIRNVHHLHLIEAQHARARHAIAHVSVHVRTALHAVHVALMRVDDVARDRFERNFERGRLLSTRILRHEL